MAHPVRQHTLELGGRRVAYSVVVSRSARSLRVRVGPHGVQVIQPPGRSKAEVESFLTERRVWLLSQLKRVEHLRGVWRTHKWVAGRIPFRGVSTPIRLEATSTRERANKVSLVNGAIVIRLGGRSSIPPQRSLETWLRGQAREAIQEQVSAATLRIKRPPGRLYVMGQRTKWGNCSTLGNLSFNWRLILAPDFVLRYLVTHEVVHLAIPDHSARFWLTVQSICPRAERARQWLAANGRELLEPTLLPIVLPVSGDYNPTEPSSRAISY